MGPLRFLRFSRVQHDTFGLLLVETFYKLSGIVLLVVISRSLPPRDIGVYFFAVSFAESFIVLATFRLQRVLIRRVAADPAKASEPLSQLIGFRLLSSPLYLLCVLVVALALAGGVSWVILVVALFTLLDSIYASFANFFLALGKVTYDVTIGAAVQACFLATFLFGMWWAPSLNMLLEVSLLRSLLLSATAVFVTHLWLCPLRASWNSNFIKEGAPFIFIALLAMLSRRVDTLLLGFLLDYATVGRYQLASRVVDASLFVPRAVGLALFPQLASQGLTAENRRTLVRGATFIVVLGLLVMGAVLLLGTPLTIVLYGPLAGEIVALLRLLAFLFPLSFLWLFLSSALQALHQEKKVLRALAVGAGISFFTNWALISLFGVYGAVYARVLSALIQAGLLSWYLWRLFRQYEFLVAGPQEAKNLTSHMTGLD